MSFAVARRCSSSAILARFPSRSGTAPRSPANAGRTAPIWCRFRSPCSSRARRSGWDCRSGRAPDHHIASWCRRIRRRPGSTTSHRQHRRCRFGSGFSVRPRLKFGMPYCCSCAPKSSADCSARAETAGLDVVVVVANAAVEDDEVVIIGGVDQIDARGIDRDLGRQAGQHRRLPNGSKRELRIEDAHAGQRSRAAEATRQRFGTEAGIFVDAGDLARNFDAARARILPAAELDL